MDKKLCEKCIHSQYSSEHKNSVCEVCYHIEYIGNGNNSYFIEKINMPDCCGECKYCIDKEYCRASQTFDTDERNITMQYIRKNYLSKGNPQWCPLRN